MSATANTDRAGAGTPPPGSPTIPPPKKPKLDPRYVALRNFAISISVFNTFGYTLLGFEQPWLWPIIAVLTGYVTEIALEVVSAWANGRAPRFLGNGARGVYEFLLPSHITALAVNMLLYANNQLWPVLFGVFCGVAAKHVLQAPIAGRMRHYMNPSNFGIAVILLVFPWASIAPPYHFTENTVTTLDWLLPLGILMFGTMLNAKLTGKMPLILGWLGAFVLQAVLRWLLLDHSLLGALVPMTGLAFILFTNYMITDPGTTPSGARDQFMFGASVGMVYGVLLAFNVVYTLFFAVTIVCLARGAYWWVASYRDRFRRPQAALT